MRYVLNQWARAGRVRAGGVGFLIAMLMPAVAEAAVSVGTCNPTKVTYAASTTGRQTSSMNFVNLPEAGPMITQGGASASCVIVFFDADVSTTASEGLTFRATIDGSSTGVVPGSRQTIVNSTFYETRSGSYVIPKVAPGNHRIRIQYKSNGGTPVYVINSNVVIFYAP